MWEMSDWNTEIAVKGGGQRRVQKKSVGNHEELPHTKLQMELKQQKAKGTVTICASMQVTSIGGLCKGSVLGQNTVARHRTNRYPFRIHSA